MRIFLMKRLPFHFCLLILLTSCATELKYKMNNHKFLTPETKGEFIKGDGGISLQTNNKIVLASANDSLVFNLPTVLVTEPTVSTAIDYNLALNLGLLSQLDVYAIDSTLGVKFQFLGASEKEQQNDWKAAIALAYGYKNNTSSDDITYHGSNSGLRTYSARIKIKDYNTSLIIGKRVSEKFLIYLNLLRDYYNYQGTLTSNQFSPVNDSGHSVNLGALLGMHITGMQGIFIKAEAGVVSAKLNNRPARTAATGGGMLGWSWL